MYWNLKRRIFEVYGSQSNFSMMIGESEPNVSRVIRGRKRLSKEDQRRWAITLKCKPEELFGEDGLKDR